MSDEQDAGVADRGGPKRARRARAVRASAAKRAGVPATPASAPPRTQGRSSFATLTAPPNQIAGLYAYSQLDGLIELARLVASDFFARPHLYTALGDLNVAARLAALNARMGSDERVPSREQRLAIFIPLFGADPPEPAADFVRLRDGLLAGASAFAEWSQATGIPMLRERVRTEHRPFKEYLNTFVGDSTLWSRQEVLPNVADDMAYEVLRDSGVIAVFGLTRPPAQDWPWVEDANGDQVVEEIAKRLAPSVGRAWTREGFSAQQRVALRGAEAIARALAFDEGTSNDAELDELITRCYTWHAALKAWISPSAVLGTRNGPPATSLTA